MQVRSIRVKGSWTQLFDSDQRALLEDALPAYLAGRRWFGGKARQLRSVRLVEAVALPSDRTAAYLATAEVSYREGAAETYVLSLAYASDSARTAAIADADVVVHIVTIAGDRESETGVLFEAFADPGFCRALVEIIAERRPLHGTTRTLVATAAPALREILGPGAEPPPARVLKGEQSNTSVIFGDQLILKLFRRTEEGLSPDLELGRFLTDTAGFCHSPRLAGALELQADGHEPFTVAMLQQFMPNRGDAWGFTLDALDAYYERVHSCGVDTADLPQPNASHRTGTATLPDRVRELIGSYLTHAELLGRRTGELHVALASGSAPAFAPEPFTSEYQRSLHQSLRAQHATVFGMLRDHLQSVPPQLRDDARAVLALAPDLEQRTQPLLDHEIDALRIRCHGDYHLGQVLFTGDDFVIIDFEGEPLRSIHERRIKVCPLRDVAGMLRSFHYAAVAAVQPASARGIDRQTLEPWTRFWHQWVCAQFWRAYAQAAAPGAFLPKARADLDLLLEVYLLEKAAYELVYELNNRPDWLRIPLQGLRSLIESDDR